MSTRGIILFHRFNGIAIQFLLGYLYVVLPIHLSNKIGIGGTAIAYILPGVGFVLAATPALRLSGRVKPQVFLHLRDSLTGASLILLSSQSLSSLWPFALGIGFVTLLGGAAGAVHHFIGLLYGRNGSYGPRGNLAFIFGMIANVVFVPNGGPSQILLVGGLAILVLTWVSFLSKTPGPEPSVRAIPLYPSEKEALARFSPMIALHGFGFGLAVLAFPLWLAQVGAHLQQITIVMAGSFIAQILGKGLRMKLGGISLVAPLAGIAAIHALMALSENLLAIAALFVARGVAWGIVASEVGATLRSVFRPGAEPTASTVSTSLLAVFGAAGTWASLSFIQALDFYSTMVFAGIIYSLALAANFLITPTKWRRQL